MFFKISSAYGHNSLLSRINKFCTASKQLSKTHYEVLNVKKDCSSKDIKDAFIQLSKQYHPDTKSDTASQKKFVRILEAYNILSKPHLRKDYDLGLIRSVHGIKTNSPNAFYQYDPQYERARRDPSFWEYRDKSQDRYYDSRGYYGIKGIRKVSNAMVVLICLLFTAIGVSLQVILIRKSVTFKHEDMIRRSIAAEEVLRNVRREAMMYGNEVQLQRMKERFEKNELAQKATGPKD